MSVLEDTIVMLQQRAGQVIDVCIDDRAKRFQRQPLLMNSLWQGMSSFPPPAMAAVASLLLERENSREPHMQDRARKRDCQAVLRLVEMEARA